MIKAQNLMIGDWVQVEGKPVEVRMLSRKKIGYLRDGDRTRLCYARLVDVEPLEVKELVFGMNEWIVNGDIRIKIRGGILNLEVWGCDEGIRIKNILGESLVLDTTYVHKLQHILKTISGL